MNFWNLSQNIGRLPLCSTYYRTLWQIFLIGSDVYTDVVRIQPVKVFFLEFHHRVIRRPISV